MKKYVALLSARASASVMQALLLLLVARACGPRAFGVISIVMAVATFVAVLVEFGMGTYLSRACAQNDGPSVRAVLRINAVSTVFLTLASAAAAAAAAAVIPIGIGGAAIAAIATSSCLDRYSEVTLACPVASGRMAPVAASLAMRRVLALGFYLSIPVAETPLRFGLALLCGQLIATGYSAFISISYANRYRGTNSVRKVFRSSFPYFVVTIAGQFRSLDSAVVSIAAGAYVAGIYSAAYKLVQPVFLLTQPLTTLLLPRSSRIRPDAARRDARRLYAAAVSGFGLIVPAIVWARPLVEWTLGEGFLEAVGPLRIMLAALPLIAAAAPLGSLLQGQGEERFVSRCSAAFAVAVVIGVAAGAFVGGAVGAAVGLVISYVMYTLPLVIRVENLGSQTGSS